MSPTSHSWAAARQQPQVRYVDVDQNGYMLLDIDRERAQAEWYFERDVRHPLPDERLARAFATPRGSHRLEEVGTGSAA